jgi:UDP-N-acetylglucosamine 2-epimerase (non-hydrolysing)
VDAVKFGIKKLPKFPIILESLELKKNEYFLVTFHREENVEYKDRLESIIKALFLISEKWELPIVFPIHPRTNNCIKKFKLNKLLRQIKTLKLIQPVDFLNMLVLEKNARLILTDSGGIQEEACTLGVPTVVLRDRTDRPEAIEVGAATLAGCNMKSIYTGVKDMLEKKTKWKNPYGDGKAAKRICSYLLKYVNHF